MKYYKKKHALLKNLPVILVFLAVTVIVVMAISVVRRTSSEESLTIAENSIRRAVITCYAQEGRYPESIEYLKENYGLYISDDYTVRYNIFASNIMPDIVVSRKQVSD